MKFNKIYVLLTFLTLGAVFSITLNSCTDTNDLYFDKATYDDVLPTPQNILDLAVQDRDFTMNDLGLTKDEKAAINYYKNNTVTFVDMGKSISDVYIDYQGEKYSVSNHAYDIKLIEEFFGISVDVELVDSSADAISLIGSGQADIITEFVYSDSRDQYIDFISEASVSRPKYYYTIKGDASNDFIDLLKLDKSERVIAVSGTFEELTTEFITSYGLQVITYATADDAIQAVARGDVRGYISGTIDAAYYGAYTMENISRYNTSKTYSVAYKEDDQNIEHLANAIHKLLNKDTRNSYNKLLNTLLLSNGTYLTADEATAIAYYSKDNPLKVEMPVDSFPDSYVDNNGNWAGIAVDAFEYRAKILGIEYEIVTSTDAISDDILDSLGQNGNTPISDVGVAIWHTPARDEYLDFTEPLLDVNFSLVGRDDTPDIVNLDEIALLEIGITKNYGYIELILDIAFSPNKEYIVFETEKELIEAYKDGEIDYFMIADRHLGNYEASYKLYDTDIKYTFAESTYSSYGFVSSAYSEGLVSAFNKAQVIDNVSRYTEYYEISESVQSIISNANRNMVFIFINITIAALLFIIGMIYKKRQIAVKEARTDKLTDIGNRRAFFEACENIKLSKYKILYVDMSNFKVANDIYGHEFGDLVLKVVAKRLDAISANSNAYRLGGDEFIVVIPIEDKTNVKKAIKDISKPISEIQDEDNNVTPNIGDNVGIQGFVVSFACGLIDLSKFPDFDDLDVILKYVDLAMYKAKSKEYSSFSYVEVDREFMKTFDDITSIEAAVAKGDLDDVFYPVFQPLLHVKTNRIVGYEALVRYKNNPKLSPIQFLNVINRNGKLKELDLYMLDQALKSLDELIKDGILPKTSRVSSNLGPQTIAELKVSEIDKIFSKYDITKENVYLEISEDSILSKDTLLNIHKLKTKGYSLAIDDFTAGNSSLSFLSELDVDGIKLDQQLLNAKGKDLTSDDRHLMIYESVTELSKKLGFGIVSEGVETKAQLDLLKKYNVDIAQGYYIARPLPKDELIKLIEKINK